MSQHCTFKPQANVAYVCTQGCLQRYLLLFGGAKHMVSGQKYSTQLGTNISCGMYAQETAL